MYVAVVINWFILHAVISYEYVGVVVSGLYFSNFDANLSRHFMKSIFSQKLI